MVVTGDDWLCWLASWLGLGPCWRLLTDCLIGQVWREQCQHQPASASTLHPSHRLDQDTPHPPFILSFCYGRQVLHLDFVVFRFKNIDPSLNILQFSTNQLEKLEAAKAA